MFPRGIAPPTLLVVFGFVFLSPVAASAVEGIVLAVPQPDLCEISIGSDDGLKKGHKLHVFRITDSGGKYVGRITVMKTSYDRAACTVDPGYRKLEVQRGDRVKSQIP